MVARARQIEARCDQPLGSSMLIGLILQDVCRTLAERGCGALPLRGEAVLQFHESVVEFGHPLARLPEGRLRRRGGC